MSFTPIASIGKPPPHNQKALLDFSRKIAGPRGRAPAACRSKRNACLGAPRARLRSAFCSGLRAGASRRLAYARRCGGSRVNCRGAARGGFLQEKKPPKKGSRLPKNWGRFRRGLIGQNKKEGKTSLLFHWSAGQNKISSKSDSGASARGCPMRTAQPVPLISLFHSVTAS